MNHREHVEEMREILRCQLDSAATSTRLVIVEEALLKLWTAVMFGGEEEAVLTAMEVRQDLALDWDKPR